MAKVLSIISMVSYIVAIVFSLISVFLWIKFRILEVIGDLSGKTAKKSITKLRKMNEKNGAKFYPTNLNTEKNAVFRENEKANENDTEKGMLYENKANNLSISVQTGLMSGETMEIVDTDETSELEAMWEKGNYMKRDKIEEIGFELIEEIIFVHTDEVTV